MGTFQLSSGDFDEKKSLQLINEMLQVSQHKIKNDGILMIIWGWIMTVSYLLDFYLSRMNPYPYLGRVLKIIMIVITVSAFLYSVYYIYIQNKKVQTYIGISLRYIWGALVVSLMLINVIQFNVRHEIIFELQHPIFMVVIAFAVFVTGVMLRYKLIMLGGVIFALLGFVSSYLPLSDQLLLEALAWSAAFIVPGHILYSKRKVKF